MTPLISVAGISEQRRGANVLMATFGIIEDHPSIQHVTMFMAAARRHASVRRLDDGSDPFRP